MGLAPYGKPEYSDAFLKIIYPKGNNFEMNLDYFTHHQKIITMAWDNGKPVVEPFHSGLFEKCFGPAYKPDSTVDERKENIAASLQKTTEEIIFHLVQELYKLSPSDNLCLAGGVAMNSVVNGKIHRETSFKNVFIPVGAADNGTSIGAAFYIWNKLLNKPRDFELKHAFWGPESSEAKCLETLKKHDIRYSSMDEKVLLDTVADALCNGKVVGWFQGRMEFGARALGNRSLLADPRRKDMRDIINLKIKFREKFRPFAPSVLKEKVTDYFEDNVTSPFMEKVIPIKMDKQHRIPAVTHIDGTGRLQTVDKDTNPLYWKLIKAFEKRTDLPLILNTSLNENEPIVNTPEEAIQCFLRTEMDAIALGPYFVERK